MELHIFAQTPYLNLHEPAVFVMQKASEAAALGRKWQESILDVCDQHFFFTQVCSQFSHLTLVLSSLLLVSLACNHFACSASAQRCSTVSESQAYVHICCKVNTLFYCFFVWLQIENFDQTTPTALQQWDDHEDLTSYDFSADDLQAPDNVDDKRKLAYR